MVKNSNSRTTLLFVLIIIAALMVLGLSPAAVAQEEEDLTPTMEEEYLVELNDVGDGHIVHTITYSEEDYEVVKEIAEESDGFLTRRYTSIDNVGELIDFNTEFDDENSSVVITYDMPGFAYYSEDKWMVIVFPEEPEQESDLVFTTTDTYTVNYEFTLFTDQVLESTTTVELPADATNSEYDSSEEAITYETDPPGSALGFWSENRATLIIVFGLLCALFLGLLIFTATRKTGTPGVGKAIAASPGPVTDMSMPAAGGVASTPPGPPGETAPPVHTQPPVSGQEAAEATEEATAYCTSCGHEIPTGKQFCTRCGKPVNS